MDDYIGGMALIVFILGTGLAVILDVWFGGSK
jgi:hypothetical protein